jgi:hypothetical protein
MKKISTAAVKAGDEEFFPDEADDRIGPGRSIELVLRAARSGGSTAGTETEHNCEGDARGVRKHAALPHRVRNGDAFALFRADYPRLARQPGVELAALTESANRSVGQRGTAMTRQGTPSAACRTNLWESQEYAVRCGRARRPVRSRSNQGTFATVGQPQPDAPCVQGKQGIAAADRERPILGPTGRVQRQKQPVYSPTMAKMVARANNRGPRTCNKQSPARW